MNRYWCFKLTTVVDRLLDLDAIDRTNTDADLFLLIEDWQSRLSNYQQW